jgi:hypothetical protein
LLGDGHAECGRGLLSERRWTLLQKCIHREAQQDYILVTLFSAADLPQRLLGAQVLVAVCCRDMPLDLSARPFI